VKLDLPRLEEMLTDPDEFVSNAQLKAFAMELLDELPVPGLDNANAVDCQAILEVVLRAAAGSTSVNLVTHDAADTPDRKAVMDRLHLVEADPLSAALNRLLGRLAMTCLDSDRARNVAIDFMANPYHGECFEAPGELCSMNARDGTTTCHRYCTAFVIAQGKQITLAVTPVRSDESREPAIDRVLTKVDALPIETEALLMDRAAYTGEVLGRLRETAPPDVPVRCVGTSLREALATNRSSWTEYTICAGTEHEQTFPLAVNPTYQNGDRGKHDHAVHGYVAYGHAAAARDRSPTSTASAPGSRRAISSSGPLVPPRPPRIRSSGCCSWRLGSYSKRCGWCCGGPSSPNCAAAAGAARRVPRRARLLHGLTIRLDQELGWRSEYRTNGVGLPADQGLEFG
jgi:hypothetical protein